MSEHPELDGYEPYEERPRRSGRRMLLLRAVVLVAVLALLLPGLVTTVSLGARNAELACDFRGALLQPGANRYEARFELFGPGGIGWECYATDQLGDERHVTSMGLIPVAPGPGSEPIDTRDT
ncbi:hypothetical protein OH146_11575 [Salinibacterium sp. SYSU T00001]|uniref:hypothetical protein n=1 Tax=Homoserinimonas sedimenticola TaxID=2986805 RepID=UPI002235C3DF|nr:hypothetical protein [Salinibacterium sedimenticola]MCW4386412.1 hypothetical protein [Salinibacterium sedimenticola]